MCYYHRHLYHIVVSLIVESRVVDSVKVVVCVVEGVVVKVVVCVVEGVVIIKSRNLRKPFSKISMIII